MYLTDLIKTLITNTLKEKCIGKRVTFKQIDQMYSPKSTTILCKDVKFCSDDGDCWIEYIDQDGNKYLSEGQGIDIWLEIENNI